MAFSDHRTPISKLILVPALITGAVTLLRLVGELNQWSPILFGASPGGGGSLVGIAWLVPIFGIYFALKLGKSGELPRSTGKAIGLAFLGILVVAAIGFLPALFKGSFRLQIIAMAVGCLAALPIVHAGWPALSKTLLAYAFAARIPVAIVMLIAMQRNWGTHYDVAPPDLPPLGLWSKFFWIGLLPQVTLWISYTVIFGTIFGALAWAVAGRRKAIPATT